MTTIETLSVVVGAVAVALAFAVFAWARAGRRAVRPSVAPARERELESLQRIAAELAHTSDVEGVARALLDEIGALFDVSFAALTFVSDDAREASGFLARSRGKDVAWWSEMRIDLQDRKSTRLNSSH